MSLLLAQVCAVCDRSTAQTFCPDCQRQIRSDRLQPLSVEISLPANTLSANTLPVGALGSYERTLKQAILALKYGDRPDVAQALGTDLGQRWLKSIHLKQKITASIDPKPGTKSSLYALPIPLHASRQQERGY
ncbi:MAG: hypothetical protein DCF15_08975, partial [Phormidesmis priestleyi]